MLFRTPLSIIHKKKRGAVTPFLYGGPRNNLVLKRCKKPTLNSEEPLH